MRSEYAHRHACRVPCWVLNRLIPMPQMSQMITGDYNQPRRAAKTPCRLFRLLLHRLAFCVGVRIVYSPGVRLLLSVSGALRFCSQQRMVVQQSGRKTKPRARLVSGSLQPETFLLPATHFFLFFFFFVGVVCFFVCCTCAQSSCTLANWIETLEKKTQHGSVAGRASQPARAALVQSREKDVAWAWREINKTRGDSSWLYS